MAQVSFIDMVLLPMLDSLQPVAPTACSHLQESLARNRALWQQLAETEQPHAVIGSDGSAAPDLPVFGGQAVDPTFDECAAGRGPSIAIYLPSASMRLQAD